MASKMEQTSLRQGFLLKLFAFGLMLSIAACNLPVSNSSGTGGNANLPPTESQGLSETQIAMGIQSTLSAGQQLTAAAIIQNNNQQAEQNSQPETKPQEQPTYTPYPTYTPEPAQPTNTPEPSATSQPEITATQDMNALIQKANILVFEDVRGYYDLDPRINKALTALGLTGANVVQVGDAKGTFMKNLNSPIKWDLIIVGAEVRSGVSGEFWDAINEQLNKNVALIAEVWYLDQIASGKIAPVLSRCGIQFQSNWDRPPNYDLYDYSIYWLQPDSPVFSSPKIVMPLLGPQVYWMGDAGDLIKLEPGSSAVLLAGKHADRKSTDGVLASCLDGRVIFQTFSTHDYKREDTLNLWENYITYTLTNHFKVSQ